MILERSFLELPVWLVLYKEANLLGYTRSIKHDFVTSFNKTSSKTSKTFSQFIYSLFFVTACLNSFLCSQLFRLFEQLIMFTIIIIYLSLQTIDFIIHQRDTQNFFIEMLNSNIAIECEFLLITKSCATFTAARFLVVALVTSRLVRYTNGHD